MHQSFLRSSHSQGHTRSPNSVNSQFLSLNANERVPSERSSLSSKNSSPMSSSNFPFHPDSPLNRGLNTSHPLDLNYPRFPLGQPTPFPVQPSGTNRNAIFVPQVPNVPKVFAHFGKGTEMLATYEKFESALRRGIPKTAPETEPAAQAAPVLNFCANPNQNQPGSSAAQSSETSSGSQAPHAAGETHDLSNNGQSKSTNLPDADNNGSDTPQSSNGSAVLNFIQSNPLFTSLTFAVRLCSSNEPLRDKYPICC